MTPTPSPTSKRFVFTGGRHYKDATTVKAVFDHLTPEEVFVGDATGLDSLVRTICLQRGIPLFIFKANWHLHGRAAGPKRNKTMVNSAGPAATLIAFPGGRGTANCIDTASRLGCPVLYVASPSHGFPFTLVPLRPVPPLGHS